MSSIVPSIGRIVHYRLNEHDVAVIKARRTIVSVAQPHRAANEIYTPEPTGFRHYIGNSVSIGDVVPAMIVRVFGDSPAAPCNLQVHLDGNDIHWATSRSVGEDPGTFSWPVARQTQAQAH